MRQSGYRHELDGLDPVALLIIPLSLLLLSVMVIRAIIVATSV